MIMARSKNRHKRPPVRRSDDEMLAAVEHELTTLQALIGSFDNGHVHAAGSLATSIVNIVTNPSKAAILRRGKLVFPTPAEEVSQANMMPTLRLVGMITGIDDAGPFVGFKPMCQMLVEAPALKPFRVWWETEPIWVEGIGGSMLPPGVIPIRPEEQLSWDEREKLTRQQFVTDLRNAVGAHADHLIPASIHDLYSPRAFGLGGQFQMPDGRVVQSEDVPARSLPVHAMIRHIAEETLMAYGRLPIAQWEKQSSGAMSISAVGVLRDQVRPSSASIGAPDN